MNRRSFLQSAGFIAGSAFISLKTNAFSKLERAKTIRGRVLDGKRGVANVVISDGFSVVLTDAKGSYSITPHEKATNIFMSTPSGYEFKTNANIARHYEKLGSRNEYDFTLNKLRRNDNKHHFIIWADPQVRTKDDVQQMMETSVPDTIAQIRALGPDALVHGISVGDIAWDFLEFFEDYNKAVALMGIPFFQALGNHDMNYREGGDDTSDRTFKEFFGPTYYSFNRGKAHYVVLDDVRYLGEERKYDGYITEVQLEWLAKDLQHVKKDQLLIVNLHIPAHNSVKNNDALYKMLEGFTNVHVMSGHTHYNVNNITGGIYEHNHGAVCGAWWSGNICSDGTPRGYGVYEVNGTELSWFYKSTGLPKEHQMALYIDTLTNQKRLLANVWNWDPEWEVSYEIDGKKMGALARQDGTDPEALRLHNLGKPAKGRAFTKPTQTGHLFMAHFAPGVKSVKVIAKDRFGNIYTKEQTV
ncbi:calcineurin-like phosphoesterase C-terminal domain-containing protein [Pedobacter deserti]|uniref:calcineurin-like phosphoesterase C-terminal domain-containing protein n=1 Tax=Pedobacter deserti TaxID=2817382 RepID=UPI00210DBA25|nr:calcineurin-like phosphoesterase family protein [Pedobacter sp. SYSU D00382]